MFNFPNIDPIAFNIGPLSVTWYSLSYVIGIICGWIYLNKLISTNKESKITKNNIDDFVSWAIIGIVIGGRLGYVLFYDPVKYLHSPVDILKTYEGGMSFHGGIIGFIISAIIFCRTNKIPFLNFLDAVSIVAPIGLFLGRIANFINAELYGRITDVPWAFVFPGSDGLPRHPSQLYEAFLEGIVLFIVQRCSYSTLVKNKPGYLSGQFLVLYSIFRILVEFFREPDFKVGYLAHYFTMGQVLCTPMLAIGIILIYQNYRHGNRRQDKKPN